ncbi:MULTISPECIES: TetR/AcrR family transcriptional regulator [Nocardia]|uniref:Helix-turn-helix domain-containing protein n=1 Tax=Nocardia aurea TaxID=2144174 RepID=A0ABV3FTU5_9NOCA|nr:MULTISPECIES: TetR/AcrR family transcriptional regulator [Nocardia]
MVEDSAVPAEGRVLVRWNDFAERHRLTRDAVLGSSRGRLLEAIVASVEDKGYAATTLADIVGRARVSRSTFYEHFDTKQQCFLEALRVAQAMLARRVVDELAALGEANAQARIATMVTTFCEVVAAEPGFARVMIVESLCVDRAAVIIRDYAVDLSGEMYREFYEQAGRENPGLPQRSEALIAWIPDAIVERARRVIVEEGATALPAHAPRIIEFVHAVLGLPGPE